MEELEMRTEPAGDSQSRCEYQDIAVAAGRRNEYGLDHQVSPGWSKSTTLTRLRHTIAER